MGRRSLDLSGQKFKNLTALKIIGSSKHHEKIWLCICDCGKETVVRASKLRSGRTGSCGCKSKDFFNPTHFGTGTRLYNIWRGMKTRCTNPHATQYARYGGRGITICPEWLHDFASFRDWALSNGYRDDLTIDRIDNDMGYFPDNCRWATIREQSLNRSTSIKRGLR